MGGTHADWVQRTASKFMYRSPGSLTQSNGREYELAERGRLDDRSRGDDHEHDAGYTHDAECHPPHAPASRPHPQAADTEADQGEREAILQQLPREAASLVLVQTD